MMKQENSLGDSMKTREEIEKRMQWCLEALDDEDNKTDLQQAKIWTQYETLRWVLLNDVR